MLHTTLKHLAARKLRLLSTGVAVILGVAFMAGTLILTDTIGRTFDSIFADVNAGVDAYVRSDSSVSDPMDPQRGRIDEGIVTIVATTPGVAAVEPTVQGYTQIVGADGELLGATQHAPPTYGANWMADDELNPFALAEGRAPARSGEAVIDRGSAKAGDLTVGSRTSVLTPAGRTEVEVVGIARFGDTDSPGGASFTFFDLATAQDLLGAPGQIDGIRVAAEAGVSEGALVERLSPVVPDGTEVLTGTEITAEDQDAMAEGLSFFNTFLMTFALVALFVGSFIIYNTFSILVAQRGQELALLRAVGASRRQVLGGVLVEAVAVGAAAAAAGVVAGIGVASGLKSMLEAMGIDLPAGGLVVTADTVLTAGITGLVISVAAAVLPARRAARTEPVAAMRSVAVEHEPHRRRVVTGLVVLVAGFALMALGLFRDAGIAAVGFGAAVVFVAVAILGPTIARPVAGLLGRPVARTRGVPGSVARENALRNPRRTSATAAALMVGVALVGTITVLASSAKASIEATIRASFTGDIVVDSGSMGFGGLDPTLAARIGELPEVDAVSGVRMAVAEIDGASAHVVAVDPHSVGRVFDLDVVEGSLADLGPRQIAVSRSVADADGIGVGDRIGARFAHSGDQRLEVAAIYERDDAAGRYLLGLAAYEANVAQQLDAKVWVRIADGVDLADAKAAISHVAADHPQASVQDREEFTASIAKHIDEMLNLVYALLLLAIVIALIGIANTLTLSVIERTREFGLLRAVGMSRSQLRTTVRWESVLVALLGAVLGLTIGTGFGWALVRALESEGITTLVVPAGQLGVIAGLAAVAGVIAAVLPARKAARLDVLDALAAT